MAGRAALIWGGLGAALAIPLALAATSPLLAWRDPIYIAAGFAGVAAMALVVLQPLLALGLLPGAARARGRRAHRVVGAALLAAVAAHVAGLWITSPPDVIDALLFRSPTPFSAWGVASMWAVFAAALLAAYRLRFHPMVWRRLHLALAVVIVTGGVVHALLIVGTMETVSKVGLCALALATLARALIALRPWRAAPRRP